jgi:hypothetical protein
MPKFWKSILSKICAISLIGCCAAVANPANSFKFWGNQTRPIEGAKAAGSLQKYPDRIAAMFTGSKYHVFGIDLDNDGQSDFIVFIQSQSKTYFIKSDFSIVDTEDISYDQDGFQYYWFKDIDNDKLDELFSLTGDEDNSDYALFKFDTKTWKLSKKVKIEPVIIAKDRQHQGIYWGYPWDITKLFSSDTNGATRLYCCIADDQSDESEPVKNGLFIAFEGTPTQGDSKGSFGFLKPKLKYRRLDELNFKYKIIPANSRKKR